jgi:hypothetical protein
MKEAANKDGQKKSPSRGLGALNAGAFDRRNRYSTHPVTTVIIVNERTGSSSACTQRVEAQLAASDPKRAILLRLRRMRVSNLSER